jgi:S1-C subfamily serine protease
VFTIGFPVPQVLGEEPKFTEGSITSVSGPDAEASLLQVSIPVQPGNSGGPVVTNSGLVVGVVTASAAIESFYGRTGTLPQNVNWAINAEFAIPLVGTQPDRATASRQAAIERAKKAVCYVEAARDAE